MLEGINKARATIESDRYMVAALTRSFGGMDLREISRRKIQEHAAGRLDAGRKPRTVNRDLQVLRAVMRSAARRGELDAVPPMPMLRITDKRLRWITYDQARKLFQLLPLHQVAPVAFALETGLRKSNVARLRWDQVDLGKAMAWIHADQAKARKPIGVPLSPTAVSILESQRGKHVQSVFTYQGAPIGQLNTKAFRKALAGAGIEGFRWHDLRHTWASWHVQNGTPLHVLQELGGWASSDMVRVYAHLSIEHLREHVARNHDRVRDRHPKGRHSVSVSAANRARSRRETPREVQ